MYEEHEGPLEELVHLYVDGAFSRRELIRRVAIHTGSLAAALTALSGYEVLHAETAPGCPADSNVPADAEDRVLADVQFPGDVPLLGYLAYPKPAERKPEEPDPGPQMLPGVVVVHENRGLVEHIRDVTRRAARGGFAAL